TGGIGETGSKGSPFYHAEHIRPRHRIERHLLVSINTPKEGTLLFFTDSGRIEVSVKVCLCIVVRRHFMPFAAFLMQTNPVALALRIVVLNAHVNGSTNPREGEAHECNDRPITEPND